ncbi:hypothetical protein TYRP_016406 [Tyrophagus putrescentiae]|nr:hypothetical protein TYRP_016406 [Tyrophagus putrescentiae]
MLTDEVVSESLEPTAAVVVADSDTAAASAASDAEQPVYLVNGLEGYWYLSSDGTSILPLLNYGDLSAEPGTVIAQQQQQQQYAPSDELSLIVAAENFESFANSQQLMEGAAVEGTAAAAADGAQEGGASSFEMVTSHPFEVCHHEEQVTAVEVESVLPLMSPEERKKAAKKKRDRQKQRQQEYNRQMADAAVAGGEGALEPNEVLLKEMSTKYAHQRFPIKLWNLASDEQFEPIKWADEGTSLIIDEYLLEPTLRYFFRSHKFSSFLRQLHLYGFRKMTRMRSHKGDQEKVRTDYISEYGMDNFLRGNLDLAKKIRRFYGNIGGSSSKKAKNDEEEEEEVEEGMVVEEHQQVLLGQMQPSTSSDASFMPLMSFDPSQQQVMSFMDFGQMAMPMYDPQSSLPYFPTPVFYYDNGYFVPMTVTGPTATANAACTIEEEMAPSSQTTSSAEEKSSLQDQEKAEEVVEKKEEQQLVSIKEEEKEKVEKVAEKKEEQLVSIKGEEVFSDGDK